MEESYDITQSLFSAKASENMLAFVGFNASDPAAMEGIEGVLKIAAFTRPEGGGYLTLTFILDLEGDASRYSAWPARFRRVDQEALAARLGPGFEMLIEVPLNPFAESKQFYIEELNLYFQRLAGQEQRLLEDRVIPVLSQLLDFTFDPIDWLAETPGDPWPFDIEPPDWTKLSLQQRIKRLPKRG
ncbi:MAG TPA: hypothetical protein DCS21_06850 [Gammaproteobacteria bacterium]|nr:hypothetical protein [Gammaproteobacteria bacterium]